MAAANQEKKTPKETEIYSTEPEKERPLEPSPLPEAEVEQPPAETKVEAPPPPPPPPAPPPPRPTGFSIVVQPAKRVFSFLYRKTLRAVVVRLGKTAVGRAIKKVFKEGVKKLVKEGIKKVGAKVAAKLGIQAAITAVGAATTGVSAGVSAAIAFVVNVLIEIGSRIIDKAKSFVKKLFEKPEALLAAGVGFGVVGLAFSAPAIIAIGATMIVIGAAPILAVAIPATVGGFFAAVGAFPAVVFGALSAWTVGTLITTATIVIVGVIATATWLQVMITSSAFILPHKPAGIEELITVGEPVQPGDPTDPSLHLAERVIAIINACNITHVNKSNMGKVADCLNASNLSDSEKQIIISKFWDSVNGYYYLQCVGFVRAITAALGRDPGARAFAFMYLNPPAPAGYEGPYGKDRLGELRREDLAIWKTPFPGHIMIVIRREGDFVVVAQAWGNNGLLLISRVTAAYFDGFIRPR